MNTFLLYKNPQFNNDIILSNIFKKCITTVQYKFSY